MPAPSITMMVRSQPGKSEKGPSAPTSAMLTRQRNSDRVAFPGPIASSVVVPKPFFHGVRLYSAGVKCRMCASVRGCRQRLGMASDPAHLGKLLAQPAFKLVNGIMDGLDGLLAIDAAMVG